MSNSEIAVEGLSKHYRHARAVDGISFEICSGTVFGLLGRNGAGKTTTISCILGLMQPTSGRILYRGHALAPSDLGEIAYVPETNSLYTWMTFAEHVEMRKRVYSRFESKHALSVAEMLQVPLNRPIRAMSKGQQQSAALALAFAQRPRFMVLDEPASGLDPVAQRIVLEMIVEQGTQGVTVLLSSHHISHVERAAEKLAILDRGRLMLLRNLEDLRENVKLIEAVFEHEPPVARLKSQLNGVPMDVDGSVVTIRAERDAGLLEKQLYGFAPVSVRVIDQTLEDIFIQTVAAERKK